MLSADSPTFTCQVYPTLNSIFTLLYDGCGVKVHYRLFLPSYNCLSIKSLLNMIFVVYESEAKISLVDCYECLSSGKDTSDFFPHVTKTCLIWFEFVCNMSWS